MSCQNDIGLGRVSHLLRVRHLCIAATVWSTVTQTLSVFKIGVCLASTP